jgi:hypothetical protein
MPCKPVGPVGPVTPAAPVTPVAPVAPAGPAILSLQQSFVFKYEEYELWDDIIYIL